MQKFKKLPLIITLSFLTLFSQAYAEIKVVASIKPIHSLASYLMDGIKKTMEKVFLHRSLRTLISSFSFFGKKP